MIPEPGSFTTPTPRTDDQQWVPDWNGLGPDPKPVVDAGFARELERELAATVAELNRVAKDARAIALANVQPLADTARLDWLYKRENADAVWFHHRVDAWFVRGNNNPFENPRAAIDFAMKTFPNEQS